MELVGENAVERFRELLGPTDSAEAKVNAPNTLRAHFGSDTMRMLSMLQHLHQTCKKKIVCSSHQLSDQLLPSIIVLAV